MLSSVDSEVVKVNLISLLKLGYSLLNLATTEVQTFLEGKMEMIQSVVELIIGKRIELENKDYSFKVNKFGYSFMYNQYNTLIKTESNLRNLPPSNLEFDDYTETGFDLDKYDMTNKDSNRGKENYKDDKGDINRGNIKTNYVSKNTQVSKRVLQQEVNTQQYDTKADPNVENHEPGQTVRNRDNPDIVIKLKPLQLREGELNLEVVGTKDISIRENKESNTMDLNSTEPIANDVKCPPNTNELISSTRFRSNIMNPCVVVCGLGNRFNLMVNWMSEIGRAHV